MIFILLLLLGYVTEAVCLSLTIIFFLTMFAFMDYFAAENAAWREIQKDPSYRNEVK